jgi:hypothetical protein
MEAAESLPSRSYAESWRDYRRRVRLWWWSGLGGFAFMVLFMLLAALLIQGLGISGFRPVIDVLFPVFGFAWLAVFAVSTVRLQSWRCPRCGNSFFARGFGRNPLARRCLHCGLPKLASGSQSKSAGNA